MAVSPISVMENPQDPSLPLLTTSTTARIAAGDGSNELLLTDHDKYDYPVKRKKPSRTLLYLRNRARSPHNVVLLSFGLLLFALSVHRILSLYMTHKRWLNAPITYMERTCPAPGYDTWSLNSVLASPNTSPAAATSSTSDTHTKQQQRQPRICLTTLTDSRSTSLWQRLLRWRDFDGILVMTWQNKFDYAVQHGYHLHDGSVDLDTTRPPAWSKIPAVQTLLERKRQDVAGDPSNNNFCDWVMWLDADTVIMNSHVRIEDFLPSDSTKDLLVGSDNGGGYNSGVFLVRNTAWSRQFLQNWWDMEDYVRPPGLSLSGDNYALKALLADMADFDAHVLAPPRCTFNSFAKFLTLQESLGMMDELQEQEWFLDDRYYHKGDFIAHTPGYDNKAECLRLLLQEAQ